MFKKIIAFLVLSAAFLVFPKVAFGFGITPAEINIQDLKPGSHYETVIYVTRPQTEANENLKVVLETDLGDMSNWFKFIPGKEFDFPSGKNTTSFKVIVDVPGNVELKNFSGQITAKGLSDKKASEGVTIIKGAVLGVNVVTSDVETLDLKVLSMTAPDVNSGDPVRLLINIKNSGNTAVAPDRVNLEIMDLFEKPMESLSSSTLEKIEPFATKEIQAVFDSNLEKGQYRVDASVIFQGKEIAKQRMILTVNAKPAKTQEAIQKPVSNYVVSRINQTGLILTTFGMLILVLILLLYSRRVRVSDPDFEKRLAKLVRENRLISWFLVGISIILVLAGIYLYLSPNTVQTQSIVEEPSTVAKIISPTVTPSKVSASESGKQVTEVKGISTTAQETNAPFVVSKPGTQGLYPVYSTPAFSAEIIYEAKNGETFNVIRQIGDWYNVQLIDGTSGWLHKSSIKK
jgi:Bacterial SH3 domain